MHGPYAARPGSVLAVGVRIQRAPAKSVSDPAATPVFSFPAIGCAPTKCDCGRHQRFRPFDQVTLHAPDVAHDGPRLEAGRPFLEMPFIRIDRCGQEDKSAPCDTFSRVRYISIDGAHFDSRLEIFHTPPDADDGIGQFLPVARSFRANRRSVRLQ